MKTKLFLVDTIQELHTTIRNAVKAMRNSDYPITAVVSGSELFSRFITLGKFDDKTMDECKEIMVHRGQVFLKKLLDSRSVIAIKGAQYINDGCVSKFTNFCRSSKFLFFFFFNFKFK